MRAEIERRPLLVALIGLVVGLTSLQHPVCLLALIPLLGLCRSLRSWLTIAVSLVVGLVVSPEPIHVLTEQRFVSGEARIASFPIDEGAETVADADMSGLRLQMRFPRSLDANYGDVWQIKGVAHPAPEASEAIYVERGLQGWLKVDAGGAKLVRSGPGVARFASSWRRDFVAFTASAGSPQDSEWIDALWFRAGNLSRIDQSALESSGSFHLVAASGLQVYVLTGMVMGLLALARLPRPAQIVVTLCLLATYCLATGAHLPTLRACLGSALFLCAPLLRREPDALSSLSLACLIFLVLFPRTVYGLAFQLSAVTVAALALFAPQIDWHERTLRGRLVSLGKGFVAGTAIILLAGQPILAAHTGKIQFAAIPANLLLLAVMPVLLCLALGAYLINFLVPAVAKGILVISVAPLTGYVRWVVQTLAAGPMEIRLPPFSPLWLVLYYGLWLASWRPRAKRC